MEKRKIFWRTWHVKWFLVIFALVGTALFLFIRSCDAEIVPPKEELPEVRGTFLSVAPSDHEDQWDVFVESESGDAEKFVVNRRFDCPMEMLWQAARPGVPVELRYWEDGGYRMVVALVMDGTELLSYEEAWQQDKDNQLTWVDYVLFELFAFAVTGAIFFALQYESVKAQREWEKQKKFMDDYAARERKRDEKELRAHYSDAEYAAIEAYIGEAFGPVERIFFSTGEGMRLDIAVCAPGEGRNFYTVSTIGMGAHRMDVPKALSERNLAFAELTMLLPPDWDMMNDTWPFRVLSETAKRPFENFSHLSAGDAYRNEKTDDSGFDAVLVIDACVQPKHGTRVMLPDGRIVNFYTLVPIYREEWYYILRRNSSWYLWRRMRERGMAVVTAPERECCVDPETWLAEDLAPFSWAENEDECILTLEVFDWLTESFAHSGLETDGLGVEKLAEKLAESLFGAQAGELLFDSCRERFFAACRNGQRLEKFALELRDLCENTERMDEMLSHSENEEG